MSIDDVEKDNLLDQLADEFAARFRHGERPSLKEYTNRYPDLAADIRELFPALVEVAQAEVICRDRAEAEAADATTTTLSQVGDYRVVREIGRGGMGVVYEAEQVSLGRRVALKVLPCQAARNRTSLERFRREARASARLHHTNIVPVFEVGQDGEVRYYAMQFIQGQSLDRVIDELRRLRGRSRQERANLPNPADDAEHQTVSGTRADAASLRVADSLLSGQLDRRASGAAAAGARESGPQGSVGLEPVPPPSTDTSAVMPGGTQLSTVESRHRAFHRGVAHIGRQAASALAHAHARGIVHRDIKPSNLLLDTEGVVWITDFGLAKVDDDDLTRTGDILGTLRYMAPERFRGQGEAGADIYALGLTLYELLVLRPAFDASDRVALSEQIKTVDPPRPRSIDPRVPRDLETIVLKATEKDPKARYASAETLAEDLRRFLDDEPILARRVRTAERYWRWARRNKLIATLSGALTAVLVAVTVGSIVAAAYFKESARRESNLAGREQAANQRSQRDRQEAIEARRQAIEERDRSRRQSADLALDKGIALAREGHADRGLLWMLEALKTAPDDAEEFRRMVRSNLGAWLGQVHQALRIIDTGSSNFLAFSPDGRSFATGYIALDRTLAKSIVLWDTASGRKLSSLPGTFAAFAFHPDGKVLVAQTDERRMVAIDLLAGRTLWTTPPLPGEVAQRVEFAPDARTVLAARSDGSGGAWILLRLDVATGQELGEPILSRGAMAVAPNGRAVATSRVEDGQGYIDVLDLPSSRRIASWRASLPYVLQFLFSPDAKSLFGSVSVIARGGVDEERTVAQIWDSGTGRPISPLMALTTFAVYTPSADRLVTWTDNLWLLRDASNLRVRGSGFPGDYPIASHPDGRTMLARARGSGVVLWRVSADAEPISDGGTDKQASMARRANSRWTRSSAVPWAGMATHGRLAISLARGATDRELIRLSDPGNGRPSGRPALHHAGWIVRAVAFSPDGRCFATGSHPNGRTAGEVRLCDASTGRLLFRPMPHTNYVAALAFQPDGKVLAAGDFNGLVRTWDTSIGREIGRPLPQGEIVLCLAYSPDGKVLAVGLASDHTHKPGTRLWNTTTRQPIGELLPSAEAVTRIEFRPDGRALLAGNDRLARLWDVTTGRAIGEPMVDETSEGFSPEGREFLTLGMDGTLKLRDATTGEVRTTLLSSSPATCAAFRSDGGLLAVGCADGTVRLCDPATSQPVGPPRSMRHAIRQVAFASDGRTVAAIDELGESRTWPVPEPLQDASLADLTLRIEARTGLRMETGRAISRLDGSAWRERLEQVGRLDPAAVRADPDPAWHEPMIREAEQNGNVFAALWHLDRLIAARSDDWFLFARRARAWSGSDKLDRAAADYKKAEQLGSGEQVLDFQTHCVVDCTRAERWAEALWYLDRLIAARPDDGMLHEDRAAVYGKLGREADRQTELARVFELGADEGLVLPRAAELGRSGRWPESAGLLARCGRTGPLSQELAQAWVIACLKACDSAGYREACEAFMTCQGPKPTVVWNELTAATLFALGANGLSNYQVPIGWLESRLSAVPGPAPIYRHLFSTALGGLLHRTGRSDEAISRLNEAVDATREAKNEESPANWAYLSLAHARKGNVAEARRWLERLRAVRLDSRASFWDVQEVAILRSEAESLLFDAEFPIDPFRASRPR
jgi:eukaryotic-like serine/threonine-protein kinase